MSETIKGMFRGQEVVLQVGNHLTISGLAKRYDMHPVSLSNWRVKGKGPKFIKVGKKIFYPLEEVEAYELNNTKGSTVG